MPKKQAFWKVTTLFFNVETYCWYHEFSIEKFRSSNIWEIASFFSKKPFVFFREKLDSRTFREIIFSLAFSVAFYGKIALFDGKKIHGQDRWTSDTSTHGTLSIDKRKKNRLISDCEWMIFLSYKKFGR